MSIWKIHLENYLFTDYVSKSYIDGRILQIALQEVLNEAIVQYVEGGFPPFKPRVSCQTSVP